MAGIGSINIVKIARWRRLKDGKIFEGIETFSIEHSFVQSSTSRNLIDRSINGTASRHQLPRRYASREDGAGSKRQEPSSRP